MKMAEGGIRSSGADTKPYRKYCLQPERQCATSRLVVWTCNLNCDEITESASTTTETESENSSTETPTTLTAGIAIGTYTAFAETSGRIFIPYSAEISSLTAGLYNTAASTSTTSTSKTSTSTTTSTSATATPTEELIISLSEDDNLLEDQYKWVYFVEKYDASYSVCDAVTVETGSTASEDATYPDGSITFPSDVDRMSDCVYDGTSSGPGTLTCSALSYVVQCEAVEATTNTCYTSTAPIEVTAKVICFW
ncbi:hypothetical protein N7504_006694 [Penicillium tannophilum]|nr:hypothetical protein N7504_006694 [Penicillium tannophilum]